MPALESQGAAEPRGARIWSFADILLDERSLELKVAGQVCDLDRKPLEVLLHLLRHAGEVVTKDELVEAVWPGRIISDSNLTKTVAVMRAALGGAGPASIKTVHGYGYRLVAPVSVQMPSVEDLPPRFDFKPGESPPLRPNWKLSSRLGLGGHGEVWLARHDKTDEPRVFKFAEGGTALSALKREVTLNRLLREMLPGREDFLQLLDWNFDQPPLFVECEYAEHGSLAAWAQSQGGLSSISQKTRLDLFAQVAEAVAAAHSVGVLHKDLKPANVLIEEVDGKARIRLCDFGSGAVMDRAALAALGITALGFTRVAGDENHTSGTPLYLAPEVVAGQPFTVQSDIYALGVMLYQLVAGDFSKSLAPGWERDVPDELLREDIAQAAAGDPASRLGDASALGQRVRSLGQRQKQGTEERLRREQAGRAQRMRRELVRLRAVAAVLLVATGVAIAAGVLAFKSRNAERQAGETTQAVNEFLIHDLLAQADPSENATRELTVRRLLDRAAEAVEKRFPHQPEIAAQVHYTLGLAYYELSEVGIAQIQFEKARALYSSLYGESGLKTLDARLQLARVMAAQGRNGEACDSKAEIKKELEKQLGADDPRRLLLRASQLSCFFSVSEVNAAIPEIEAVVAELERRDMTDDDIYESAMGLLVDAETSRGRFDKAWILSGKLLALIEGKYGEHHGKTAGMRLFHAGNEINLGKLAQADAGLQQAVTDLRAWGGEESREYANALGMLAILRIEQGKFAEAEGLFRGLMAGPFAGGFRVAYLSFLAESLLLQGQLDEALSSAKEVVADSERDGLSVLGKQLPARNIWAEVLRIRGDLDGAWQVLSPITEELLKELPADSEWLALYRRSQGLLWKAQAQPERAKAALAQSLSLYQGRYGAESWRCKRIRKEMADLP